MRRFALGIAVAVLPAFGALGGCKKAPDVALRDSEGRSFRARCSSDGKCALEQTAGARWPGGRDQLVLHDATRVVGVCSTRGGAGSPAAAECRALVCQADGECPPAHRLDKGTCLNGLCTDQSHAVAREDAVMLCLFGTGLGKDLPAQVERAAMAQHCGDPCLVPTACREL